MYKTFSNIHHTKQNTKPKRLGWKRVEESKPTKLTSKTLQGVQVKPQELRKYREKNGENALLVP